MTAPRHSQPVQLDPTDITSLNLADLRRQLTEHLAAQEDTTDIVRRISDELDYLRAGCGRPGGAS